MTTYLEKGWISKLVKFYVAAAKVELTLTWPLSQNAAQESDATENRYEKMLDLNTVTIFYVVAAQVERALTWHPLISNRCSGSGNHRTPMRKNIEFQKLNTFLCSGGECGANSHLPPQ